MRRSRPANPDQVSEGSICWYDFRSAIRGELNGPRPVAILGRQPGIRMLRRLDLQVIPLSTASQFFEDQNVAVGFNNVEGYAILDKVTTINPRGLRDPGGRLTARELAEIKRRLAGRFDDKPRQSVGRMAHLRPRDVLLIPTDRAPDGRRYVVLDNRNVHCHADALHAVPVPGHDSVNESNCRIRSFAIDRVAPLKPVGRMPATEFDALRKAVGHRLVLPAPAPVPAP